MGSGAVGVEFASIFKSYGSDVTIIELLPRLVPGEDEAVSAELEKHFKSRGIKVHTGTKVTSAKAGAKGVEIEMQTADLRRLGSGKSQKATFDMLLVATGRGPVTEGLGAEALGIKMDRGYIVVDQLFQTNVPGISAIGDVITMGGPHYQLAHVSSMEGIVLAERIAGHARDSRSTTTTCRAAPTAIPRSAASASPRRRRRPRATTSASARSRSGRWPAPAWPARPTAS